MFQGYDIKPNYLRMLCSKMAQLGGVAYCFESMSFQHANLYFLTTCIISMRKQKRFVSKQGQPRPCTQLKARLLTERLKNGLLEAILLGPLFPPRNSSNYYFDTHKFAQYPFSLIIIHPLALCYIDSKQIKQMISRKFVNCGFRSVVVITSASHAEGRQFKSGRKHFTFFFKWGKSVQST